MKKIFNRLLPASCIVCRHIISATMIICSDCRHALPWLLPEENISLALFHYQSPIDHFITQLKFNSKLMYAKFFSECFIDQLKELPRPLPGCLIPMPLHAQRLRQRGFNQAIEIAKPIAKYFKIPLLRDMCYRQKNTKPQTELSAHERATNIKNAFAIKKSYNVQHVAILDDVITTGNTVFALHQLLKNQGIKKIEIWCVARAGM